MKVVSNAGPLIALAKLGRLGLLNQLYGVVLIPPEVYREVVVNAYVWVRLMRTQCNSWFSSNRFRWYR